MGIIGNIGNIEIWRMKNTERSILHNQAMGTGGYAIGSTKWAMRNGQWAIGNANRVLGKVGRYAMHLFARMRNNRWSALRNVDHPL